MGSSLPAKPGESLIILGAGIVGCAAALTFARRGFRVTVIDRNSPGSGASHGNAGGVVPSVSILAQPALPWKVPKMLLDPTGPITIRPGEFIRSLPWFLRFLSECREKRTEASSIALYALSGKAAPAWLDLTRGTEAAEWLREVGWLKVFSTRQGFDSYQAEIDLLGRRNAPHKILTQAELRQMEPHLAPVFQAGLWQPDGLFVTNPRKLVETIVNLSAQLDVKFLTEDARNIEIDPQGDVFLVTDKSTHKPDRLMLSAGAFSALFARKAGAHPMLIAERGYHAMFDRPEYGLNRPTCWIENNMVLCPMAHGTRLTTQSEFAGLNAPPDTRRLHRIAAKAGEMLPGLKTKIRETWMGRRPSTPDSLPYLGLAPASNRIFLNFGHNHLGLTLAAISAKVAAEIWCQDAELCVDNILPYRALR